MAAGSAGRFVVVWEASNTVSATRSADGGITWSAPATVIAGIANPGLELAADGAGTWVLAFAPSPYPPPLECDIRTIRSTDDGITWGAETSIVSEPTSSCGTAAAALATDGATWIAAWLSTDTLGGTVGTDSDIHLSRSLDGGATWSPPAALNPEAASDGVADRDPRIATDGAGVWIAAWRSQNDLGGALSPGDHLLFSRSLDGGVTWSPSAAVSPTAPLEHDREEPSDLLADGHGLWLLVGSTIGIAATTASRSIDDGVTWTAPTALHGVVTFDNFTFQRPGGVATDGAGHWVAGQVGSGDARALAGTTVCVGPRDDCRAPVVPGKSRLAIKDKTPNVRDGMKWAWLGGAATSLAEIGDPISSTSYTLCVYDGADRALLGSRVPAAGTCTGQPCWRATATGFTYKTRTAADSPLGISKVKLKAGDAGKAKITIGARGESLATPRLGDSAVPLTVQLEASDTGVCWEATYSAIAKESSVKLKAQAD